MSESSSKKVITNSIVYSVNGLLIKCFSLFLLPLYTAYLTTADYGITSVANSFATTMGFIVSLSLFVAVTRFYVELKDDAEKLRRFYGTVVTFSWLSSLAWILLLTIFRKPLARYVFSGVDFYPVIVLCLITMPFNVQHTIHTRIMKSQQKALKASIYGIAFFFLSLVLNILFVVVLKKGAVGVLMTTLLVDVAFFLLFMVDMFRNKAIRFCLDIPLLKESLKYSIPIIPHNLSTQITVLVSKAIIGGTASLASLGLYSVASQFGHMADTIQTYINTAYAPWLYERLHDREQDYKTTIRKTVKLLIAVLGLLMIGIALFAQDYILLCLDKNYAGAWRFVPLIVGVFAIKIIYYFYVNVLFYYKKASRRLFVATLSGSIINVLLSSFMIPMWGAYGSIFADAIAMLIRVAIITGMSLQYEDVGLRIRDFVYNFVIIAGFIALAMAPSYLRTEDVFYFSNFLYKVFWVFVYVAGLFVFYRKQILSYLNIILRKGNKKGTKR